MRRLLYIMFLVVGPVLPGVAQAQAAPELVVGEQYPMNIPVCDTREQMVSILEIDEEHGVEADRDWET